MNSASKYFYLHDRLGSDREMINTGGAVVKMFTFDPFGKTIDGWQPPQVDGLLFTIIQ